MGKEFVKGLEGIVAAETAITRIDGLKGQLFYRGYSIYDLAGHCSFEEVAFLLLNGELPSQKELTAFQHSLHSSMTLHPKVISFIQSLPKNMIPMSALRTAVSMLGMYDPDAEDISSKANGRKALRIMAAVPVIVSAIQRAREGKKILSPKKKLGIAGNFLYLTSGKMPSEEDEKVFNTCLVLHADHEMNASTFAGRVVVSTLSDIHSAIVASISALKGPLHGGANKKAIQALHFLGDKIHLKDVCDISCLGKVDQYVLSLLHQKVKIMGIGHRVYRVKDPRAIILEQYAAHVKKDELKYYQMAKEIEAVMAKEKKLYPNVDFFSGIVYESLGINPDLYVCIFALARTPGWLANMMEQYSDNRLIRPSSIYIGQKERKFIPIEKR